MITIIVNVLKAIVEKTVLLSKTYLSLLSLDFKKHGLVRTVVIDVRMDVGVKEYVWKISVDVGMDGLEMIVL